MGLSQSLGLLALGALVPIIILYMLKPKQEVKIVASNYLWQKMTEEMVQLAKIDKLRKTLLFFLDIIIVLLITALLSGIFIQSSNRQKQQLLLIDGSLTMNAEDIEPSRFAEAKKQAIAYLKKLSADTKVSLVFLTADAELIYHQESDKNLIAAGVERLQVSQSQWQNQDVEDYLNSLNLAEDTKIVYFGDRKVSFAENYLTIGDDNNLVLTDLSFSQSNGQLLVMATVLNQSAEQKQVEVSLYADRDYLQTATVVVEPEQSNSLYFDPLPDQFPRLRAEIDNEDILALDNQRFLVVKQNSEPKIAMISSGNYFVEKFLTLKNFEVYKLEPSEYLPLEGFDLYIFDSFLPEILPLDGNLLLLDPPVGAEDLGIVAKGYLQSPSFVKAEHPINKFLEDSSFQISFSQLYQLGSKQKAILENQEGALAFTGEYQNRRMAVFGFDFRYSDLPLDVQFPIYMNNILNYLVNQQMTRESNYNLGDLVSIRQLANADEIVVFNPQSESQTLQESDKGIYSATDSFGFYRIQQADKSAYFAVNPKIYQGQSTNNIDRNANVMWQSQELDVIFYTLLLIALLAELYLRLKATHLGLRGGRNV